MKRTQIYLPVQLYGALEQEASALRLSVSEIIRRFLQQVLKSRVKTQRHGLLLDLANLNQTPKNAPRDLSLTFKQSLYGHP